MEKAEKDAEDAEDRLSATLRHTPPIGTIIMVAWDAATPDGYLLCDGTNYQIAQRPELAELRDSLAIKDSAGSIIGSIWGGDGSTNFTVPELRGEFPRFLDKGRGVDVDDTHHPPTPWRLNDFQDCSTAKPKTAFQTGMVGGDVDGRHAHNLTGDGRHTQDKFGSLSLSEPIG